MRGCDRHLVILAMCAVGCVGEKASRRQERLPPDGRDVVVLRSQCGLVFVINDGPAHLRFELRGKNLARVSDSPELWLADSLLLEVNVATATQIGTEARG